ncbi:hypothetical protein H7H78_17840 [Mycobacterium shinjukuense]|uniref:Uncharacterized protein n=1 Tax=Mycobacterium shinjukuense TaxID=398694 RepID=A0A7I7MRX0_9MYCO|nr:hypothetical protein [Mycobacterium shinjukuense]MCV6987204.1 hypothetical protein [Mycobacterium shinjukuense]BBX74009.1 hypothetical protein MSHI_19150 [Mycobacterium shinjukuense]
MVARSAGELCVPLVRPTAWTSVTYDHGAGGTGGLLLGNDGNNGLP